MKFTSIPQNGSSWRDSLPVSFDTELTEPSDVVLQIKGLEGLDITRRIYGVTQATIDVAPYLKSYTCTPPQITEAVSITPSKSAQRLKIIANGVTSPYITLFHTPYSSSGSYLLSPVEQRQSHPVGVPILLTAYTQRQLTVFVAITTSRGTTSKSYVAKTNGMPMDIVIPAGVVSESVQSIHLDIGDGLERFCSVSYDIVPMSSNATTLVWFNSSGGIESYTFPTSLRVSYDARLADGADVERYVPLSSATVCYRLCSAFEPHAKMERLAKILFSPRVFRLDGNTITPISLRSRHIEFDSHGMLKQMSLEVEEAWKGGVR